ncbi:hypothetical protein KCP73_05905 [Salmonella enterica subsp. enterica]|nr:hypothetical protein KCP73_05905 [Salmonella enterica subsp. enterica]
MTDRALSHGALFLQRIQTTSTSRLFALVCLRLRAAANPALLQNAKVMANRRWRGGRANRISVARLAMPCGGLTLFCVPRWRFSALVFRHVVAAGIRTSKTQAAIGHAG